MNFSDYLRVVRRYWVGVVALTLTGVLIAGVWSILMVHSYTASTKLFVAIQNSGSVTELQQGNTFSQARVQSYIETVSTPLVLEPVIQSLGLATTPSELAERVQASSGLNTVLIEISASDQSPVQAAAIAQGVATSLVQVVDELEKPKAGGSSPVRLTIVTPAVASEAPTSPNMRNNLLIGLLAGMLLGAAFAVLRHMGDNTIRGEHELRQLTDASLLGGVAFDAEASSAPLIMDTLRQTPRAESFRQIRTNLQFAHVSHNSKTVLVTSSKPGEGKSTTAVNLAISMSQSGQSVLLIDADLRRPKINEYLGLERNAGLTSALIGSADVNDLLQPWGPHALYVLTSGGIPPNPSELLGSNAMKSLLARLEETFDAIIIDTPPLLPVTDAAVLAQHVGGVVLVIEAQATKVPEVEKALRALEMVDAEMLGVVLNRLPNKGPDAYSYTYYTSDFDTEHESKGRGARKERRSRTRRDQKNPVDYPKRPAVSLPLTVPASTDYDHEYARDGYPQASNKYE
ncbi:polysaccharide biosynthesis tyrosine autokinase [Paenarthrobacter nicotinovorans]|uniref:polysaccharide biosynthesis tyrosine autokinase n=1 Tax=Paenarthrobacter nicotinovorans TaxID=29320 RepID=UPI0024850007|nr:polysaccharide biosynthesis tyrosine autokinase [Paenarthrobacter nicotinovorans]MDI2019859.1 Iron-sulfur cluster carrier protein [Paenarthrobacter nicotinovorans]